MAETRFIVPEQPAPARARTRAEFEAGIEELFRTPGSEMEVPSVEALEEWGVDIEDEGGGIEEG